MPWMFRITFVSCLCFMSLSFAKNPKLWDIGLQAQLYPTGLISSLNFEHSISHRSLIGLRVGHNLVRHRDLGVHDDERGQGYGFSLDYTHYLNTNFNQWFVRLRNDLWFNSIDWQDHPGESDEVTGKTEIVVLQPTLAVGYAFLIKKHFFIKPSLAFGIEWNIQTKGEQVGEGMIGLLGLSFGWRKAP